MNDPIVSPWLIWAIGAVGGVKNLFEIQALVAFFCMAIATGVVAADSLEDGAEAVRRLWVQCKRILVASAVMLAVSMLLPSRETLVGMIVASKATPANIAKGGEWLDDQREVFKADLVDVIEAIRDKEDE